MASPSCRRRSSRRSTGCSRQKSSTTSDSPLRWNSSRRSSTSALRQRSRSSPRRGEAPVCSAPEHHGAAPPARRLMERGNPDICTLRRQRKTRLEIHIHNLLISTPAGHLWDIYGCWEADLRHVTVRYPSGVAPAPRKRLRTRSDCANCEGFRGFVPKIRPWHDARFLSDSAREIQDDESTI